MIRICGLLLLLSSAAQEAVSSVQGRTTEIFTYPVDKNAKQFENEKIHLKNLTSFRAPTESNKGRHFLL